MELAGAMPLDPIAADSGEKVSAYPHSLNAPFEKVATAIGFTINFFARRYGRGAGNSNSLPLRVKHCASI